MLKILFLSHRVPIPPDRGDRIRSYHMLRYLAERHRVSLAAVADERPDAEHLRTLARLVATVDVESISRTRRVLAAAASLATALPLTVPMFWSPALKRKIDQRLRSERFDLIFIYCSAMAPYVLCHPSPPKVIDFIDADSQKWFDYARRTRSLLKPVYWREGTLLRRLERRVAHTCSHAFVASERDGRILRSIIGDTPLTILPNGVTITASERPRPRSRRLVFTGVMDYWPNVDAMTHFVGDVLPLIRQQVPDVELMIVGQKPLPQVKRLGRQPGVTVTGWVADVAPYLESAAAFVAPLRIARGIPVKILGAMGAGLPVVCTSAALGGLSAKAGYEVLVADSPEGFAAHTISLLRDPQRRDELRWSGVSYVRREHEWDAHLKRLETILLDAARHPSRDAVSLPS